MLATGDFGQSEERSPVEDFLTVRHELFLECCVFPGLWNERGYERLEGGHEGSRRGRVEAC